MEQEVGGSSPPNCTSYIKHLPQILIGRSAQKTGMGRPWADFQGRTGDLVCGTPSGR